MPSGRGQVLAAAIVEILGDDSNLDAALERAKRSLASSGQQFEQIGRSLSTAITLPLAAIGVAAATTAIQFESSFAGIRKTMNLSEASFQQLAQANRDLAKTIPISVNELNRIGELGGQLGIRGVQNITKFEDTIAKLAVTTNLTADNAALSFAQIANVMQLPQNQIDRLGSAVVGLGNNFATVETQIVEFTSRVAGAGKLVGLSAADVAGISTAFSSVGISAEAGGTAVQKLLISMSTALNLGGEKLEVFGNLLGQTGEQFKKSFKADAAGTFVNFVEALGRSGDQAIKVLADLEGQDARVIRAFTGVANAGDLVRRAVTLSNVEFQKNTALAIEAGKRFETMKSQLTLLWNRLKDVAITVGTALFPVMKMLMDQVLLPVIAVVGAVANAFAATPRPLQFMIVAVIGLVAALGPLLLLYGTYIRLAPIFATLTTGMSASLVRLTGVMTAQRSATGVLIALQLGLAKAFGAVRTTIMNFLIPALVNAGKGVHSTNIFMKALIGTQALLRASFTALAASFLTIIAPIALVVGAIVFFTKNWDVMQYQITLAWAAIKDAVFVGVDFVLGALQKLVGWIPGVGTAIKAMRKEFDELSEKSLAKSAQQIANSERRMVEWGQAGNTVEDMLKGIIAQLPKLDTGIVNTGGEIDAVKEALTEFNDAIKSIEGQQKLLGSAFNATEERAAAYRRVIEALTAAGVPFDKRLGAQGVTLTGLAKVYLDLVAKLKRTKEEEEALEQARQRLNQAYEEGLALTQSLLTPQEQYNQAIARAFQLWFIGAIGAETFARAVKAAQDALKKFVEDGLTKVPTLEDVMRDFALQSIDAIAMFAASADRSIKQFVESAIRELTRLIVKMLIIRGLGVLFPGFSKFLGFATGNVDTRALGGSVRARQPYLVGERGPELFIPSGAGSIRANSSLGGMNLRLDTSTLPPMPSAVTPDALAVSDWWRRAFGHLYVDYENRGGRTRG